MKYKRLWILILLLFIGDVATTVYGLQQGYQEKNPSVAELVGEYGEVGALILLFPIKLLAMGAAMGGQWLCLAFDEPEKQKWFPLMVLFILALPPVVWNLWLLLPTGL